MVSVREDGQGGGEGFPRVRHDDARARDEVARHSLQLGPIVLGRARETPHELFDREEEIKAVQGERIEPGRERLILVELLAVEGLGVRGNVSNWGSFSHLPHGLDLH